MNFPSSKSLHFLALADIQITALCLVPAQAAGAVLGKDDRALS
jgi:hypothetical protein